MIETVELTRLRLPLKEPYKLAIGDVAAFDTMLAEITIAGASGLGEATILTGYTTETIEESWRLALGIAAALPGKPVPVAKAHIEAGTAGAPFTATLFVTAIEMAERCAVLAHDEAVRVPLLFGLNATDFDRVDAELAAAHAAGFGTVKVKVGFEVDQDLARVRHIQRSNRGRAKLRLDANQGYTAAEAVRFAGAVEPDSVELLEQPCHMTDWQGLAEVVRASAVPIMLDESIYEPRDIDRAADIGAAFVKLKLMKLRSLDRLCAGLERIRALGMEPVLGNGVASDVGCWMEACVAHRLIRNAGEMNGFLRQKRGVVANPLQVRQGAIDIPAGYRPVLDRPAMASMAMESATFG